MKEAAKAQGMVERTEKLSELSLVLRSVKALVVV